MATPLPPPGWPVGRHLVTWPRRGPGHIHVIDPATGRVVSSSQPTGSHGALTYDGAFYELDDTGMVTAHDLMHLGRFAHLVDSYPSARPARPPPGAADPPGQDRREAVLEGRVLGQQQVDPLGVAIVAGQAGARRDRPVRAAAVTS